MIHRVRLALFASTLLLAAFASFGDPPRLESQDDQLLVSGVAPGERVAWMAFTRERVAWHGMARIRYGIGVVGAGGVLHVAHPVPQAPYILWNVAHLGSAEGARIAAPGMPVSSSAVPVHAVAGAETIVIGAPQAHLLYVSPPSGAWSISAADGGGGDADGRNDGQITVSIPSLRAIEGNRTAPATTGAGDLIMVIDPGQLRVGQAVVR